ncbi:MAG TPA: MATE family efflux transporter [Afifellaceae bacterium]|nr:MATE family efflux transporter [Afifellaceae bacterium]
MEAVATAPSQPLSWHFRRTVELAAPIAVARAAILIMVVVDTVMTGWAGTAELAALGLGVAPLLTLMMIALGFLQAVVVLTAQAIGAGDPRATGAILRAGLLQALLLGMVVLAVSAFGEPFYRVTGQPEEVIPQAAAVTIAFGAGVPGMLLFVVTNLFLEATGRPKVGMTIMLAANLLNVPLNALLVLGWGGLVAPLGAVGAIAGSSALRWLAFAAALIVLLRWEMRSGDPHGVVAALKGGGVRLTSIIRRMARIGVPVGLAQGVESAAFAAMIVLAGVISTEAQAAHQAAISIVQLAYMVAVGVAGAAAIRVGNAVGRNSPADMRRAGWSAIGLAGCLAATISALLLTAPELVARLYGLEGAALAVTAATLAVAGLVVVFDGMMGASLGALRGVGDVWVPFAVQAVAFWAGAVPLAAFTGIGLSLGAPGLMLGILAGVVTSFAALALRFRNVSQRPLRRA